MREYLWKVTVEGVEHRISCSVEGNRYVLYADDDHVANIYRKSARTMWYGLEESVTMFGKRCTFVVWDEKPDVAVDGVLIGSGVDYQQALVKKNARKLVGYRVAFWCGILLIAVLVALICFGRVNNPEDWIDTGIRAAIGIWFVSFSVWKLRRLTRDANRSIIGEDNFQRSDCSNEL